jgi:spore coat polysaccharide biosynthesis protein SpsF
MIGCIIQARMGSIRLPKKVLMLLDGVNPTLHYVLQQLEYSNLINQIVVATTNNDDDDKIINYLKKINTNFFRGNQDDVLDRYYQCAKKFSFSIIIRITADNPLIDPTLVDLMIKEFQKGNYDYMTNSIPRTFPYGTEIEIFSFGSLEKAWKNAKKDSEREHVTPYFYANPNLFRTYNFKNSENLSYLRWTLDEYGDLLLIQKIIEKIKKKPILLDDILNLHSKEPDLFKINENIRHNFLKEDKP